MIVRYMLDKSPLYNLDALSENLTVKPAYNHFISGKIFKYCFEMLLYLGFGVVASSVSNYCFSPSHNGTSF